MAQPTPSVFRFMTPLPVSLESRRSLRAAHELMGRARVRHLPIIDDGALVGLLSLDDLHLIETLKDIEPAAVPIADAMSHAPFAVPFSAPLDDVADEMAQRKITSAVVMDGPRVIGIFTSVDALFALASIVREQALRGLLAEFVST